MAAGDDEDKPERKLKPANENPWYCLMTLHGEQEEGATIWTFDRDLHTKNRRDWNRWAARALTDHERAKLLELKNSIGYPRFFSEELTPHDDAEWQELAATFRARAKACVSQELPEPREKVDFLHVVFKRTFAGQGLVLPSQFYLTYAWFDGGADFSGAMFNDAAVLACATFNGSVNFSGASFSDIAYFTGAEFKDTAQFTRATFKDTAEFRDVIFKDTAIFSNAAFNGHVNLSGANFNGDTDFSRATFDKIAGFPNARFSNRIDFSNAAFMGTATFKDTRFHAFPPNLHETTLHSDTDWVSVKWPDPPADLEAAKQHVRYFQRLKQLMETLKKHEDELDFFAREMRAQRTVDRLRGKPWKALLNYLYDLTSHYGWSVTRPVIAMIVSAILFGMIYDVLPLANGTDLVPREALGLSVTNTFAVFSFAKDASGFDAKSLSALARTLGVVQGVLGTMMMFLIGLGLRNRFRMK